MSFIQLIGNSRYQVFADKKEIWKRLTPISSRAMLGPMITSQSVACGTKLRGQLQHNLIWKMFLQTVFIIHNTLDTIMHHYYQWYIFYVKYILSPNPMSFMGLPSILQFLWFVFRNDMYVVKIFLKFWLKYWNLCKFLGHFVVWLTLRDGLTGIDKCHWSIGIIPYNCNFL